MTGGGMRAGALDARPHVELMLLIVDAPGEMVNRTHAPGAAARLGRIAHVDDACAARDIRIASIRSPSAICWKPRTDVRNCAVAAASRSHTCAPNRPRICRSAGTGLSLPRRERRVPARFDQRDVQAVRDR